MTSACSMVVMTGLMAEGLMRFAACQLATRASPIAPEGLKLAGNRHDDEIALRSVVNSTADDDCGAFFGAGLVGEWEWHQYDVAEAIAGRRRHLRDYPRHS